jgi:hypothetical protein
MAIKCPSIDVHLATIKKFQEGLRDEKYLTEVMGENGASEIQQIKPLFQGIWSLEDVEDEKSLSFEIM